jgi:hypothetical protein
MHEAQSPHFPQPKPHAPPGCDVFRLHAAYLREHPDPAYQERRPGQDNRRLPTMQMFSPSMPQPPQNG